MIYAWFETYIVVQMLTNLPIKPVYYHTQFIQPRFPLKFRIKSTNETRANKSWNQSSKIEQLSEQNLRKGRTGPPFRSQN